MKCVLNVRENVRRVVETFSCACITADGYLITGSDAFYKLAVYQFDEEIKNFRYNRFNFYVRKYGEIKEYIVTQQL